MADSRLLCYILDPEDDDSLISRPRKLFFRNDLFSLYASENDFFKHFRINKMGALCVLRAILTNA